MAEEESSDGSALGRARRLADEVQTKAIYVGLALLFVASEAGVFAASVPTIIFVALFLIAVGIDAYN